MQLNPEQNKAILTCDKPLLVLAGAGTGKTRVITQKIAHLVNQGLSPKNIYAVTFTNKAAHEMLLRCQKALKGKTRPNIATFHTLGLKILKKDGHRLGLKKNFSVFSPQDSIDLIAALAEEQNLMVDAKQVQALQFYISHLKNNLLHPSDPSLPEEFTPLLVHLYPLYEKQLQAYHVVDLDDLILKPLTLFQKDAIAHHYWKQQVQYLLVDEYQDTNKAQYALVEQLVDKRNNLTVVGDDDQAIYAWRGAKSDNLARMVEDFPDLEIIKLEQNYRSRTTILRAANHLIRHNSHWVEKALWSDRGEGEAIRVRSFKNADIEAESIATELLYLHGQGRKYEDVAILYRSNHQSRAIEKQLQQYHIPYSISGGSSLFSKPEIKDLIAYFRLLANPEDDIAFLRCVNTPHREIGPVTLEKLSLYARDRNSCLFYAAQEMGLASHLPAHAVDKLAAFTLMMAKAQDALTHQNPATVLKDFVYALGWDDHFAQTASSKPQMEKKLENIQEITSWVARRVDAESQLEAITFEEAVQKMILIDMLEQQDAKKEGVNLLTLHAAKGLEFPHVYIVGIEENILPHKKSMHPEGLEEERRLFYVGMTRAEETLTLSFNQYSSQNFVEKTPSEPSRFLQELPAEISWETQATTPDLPEKPADRMAALKAMLND